METHAILTFTAMTILALACTFLLLKPQLVRHDESLTIVRTRIGELDVNHPPDHRITVWWQEPDHGINARLLVLPW